MLNRIVDWSLDSRWLVLAALVALVIIGGYVLANLPIDAFPELTNNQVVVVTECPSMSSTEVDELVTYPIESALVGMPRLETVRSISKLGLSMITVIFEDSFNQYLARQLVADPRTHGYRIRRSLPVHSREPEQITDGYQDVPGLDAPVCPSQCSWCE